MSQGREHHLAVALAPSGATWGTEQALAAGDGMLVTEEAFGLGLQAVELPAETGQAMPLHAMYGNVDPPQAAINALLHFNDQSSGHSPAEKLIAALLGSAAVSGAGPYTHTLKLATKVSRWFTLATDRGVKTLSVPSAMPSGLEWTSETGKPVSIVVSTMGDRLNDATTLNPSAATILTLDKYVQHWMLGAGHCWLGDAAGGSALGSADAVRPSKISIKIDRKLEDFHTVDMYTDAPSENGQPEVTVEMDFPEVTTALYNLLVAARKASEGGTYNYLRADFLWQGPSISGGNLSWRWLFPRLLPDPTVDVPGPGLIPITVSFKALEAPSAPAGFTNTEAVQAEVVNQVSTAIL